MTKFRIASIAGAVVLATIDTAAAQQQPAKPPLWETAKVVDCTIANAFNCTPKGCQPRNQAATLRLDLAANTACPLREGKCGKPAPIQVVRTTKYFIALVIPSQRISMMIDDKANFSATRPMLGRAGVIFGACKAM